MIVTTRVSGAGSYAKSLRRHLQEVEKDVQDILKQEARALAIMYGSYTVPLGNNTGEKYRKKIEADVGKVIAHRDDPAGVYRMMKKHAPTLAGAYWHAHKSGKHHRKAQILRKANLPQGGASRATVKQFRTRADGAVGRIEEPVTLARKNERNKVIRESQATVGTAKAGWHQAGKALGGRMRRNIVGADGKRGTLERFPSYVRNLSRRYRGLGGAFVGKGRVSIWTNVRHAAKAMSDSSQGAAEDKAKENFAKAMGFALEARNAKWNKSA